jgi:hypothetical protein
MEKDQAETENSITTTERMNFIEHLMTRKYSP